MTSTPCKICALPSNDKCQTALGTSPVCTTCFEYRAELLPQLHLAAEDAKRTKRPIPKEIKDQITIHDGDCNYVPLKLWMEQTMRTPCVEVLSSDELDTLNRLTSRIADIKAEIEFRELLGSTIPKKERRRPIRDWIKRKWRSFTRYFDVAADFTFHDDINATR